LRLLVATVAALAVLSTAVPAAAAGSITVTTDRTHVDTLLGEHFSFSTNVANGAAEATEPLVASLNVVSLHSGVYVDPEDWSSDRTRYLGRLEPNGTVTIDWRLQAVTSGEVAVYVTVLPQDGVTPVPATSAAIPVAVEKRSTIGSGGAIVVALGVPAVVALLALAARVTRQRRP
jgi:hypothetical protein